MCGFGFVRPLHPDDLEDIKKFKTHKRFQRYISAYPVGARYEEFVNGKSSPNFVRIAKTYSKPVSDVLRDYIDLETCQVRVEDFLETYQVSVEDFQRAQYPGSCKILATGLFGEYEKTVQYKKCQTEDCESEEIIGNVTHEITYIYPDEDPMPEFSGDSIFKKDTLLLLDRYPRRHKVLKVRFTLVKIRVLSARFSISIGKIGWVRLKHTDFQINDSRVEAGPDNNKKS